MKLGLDISEKKYRMLNHPSYSLFSNISKAGPQALYGVREDISDLDGIIIGSLVDSILTDGGLPDNLVIVDKKPTAKPLKILKELVEREDLNPPNPLSVKNNTIIEEILNKHEYYNTSALDFRIKKLKNYSKYVKALADPTAFIASSYQLHEAQTLAERIQIRYGHLFNSNTLTQVKLTGEISGVTVKVMLDFIDVDHVNKVLTPYDLKTGFGPHYDFFNVGYLGYNYYIQASLYKTILENNVKKLYPEYTVSDFRFLYCGRADKLPIVYKVNEKWHESGWSGFTYDNIKYSGIYTLLEDFLFYKEHPNAFYRRGYSEEEVLFPDIGIL